MSYFTNKLIKNLSILLGKKIKIKNRESILLKFYRSVFLNNTQFHKMQLHLKFLDKYLTNN